MMLLKGVCVGRSGCFLLKSQKAGQVGEKENLLYFRYWQLWGDGGRHLSKGRLSSTDKQGVKAFIDRVGDGRATCRNSVVISNSLFKLVIGGLTSIILNVLGTVSLQFQGPFASISLWSVLRIVEAHVLGTVWSCCS